MCEDLERLKNSLPLLEYLQRHNWRARRAGRQPEFVGLCPFHAETHPSFYVNTRRNLFYCHGCGRGGDLIRFVELFLHLSFQQSVAHLQQQLIPPSSGPLLEETMAFYQLQLHRHPEAVEYLLQRGLRQPALIEELRIGYAPGGNLRQHLSARGYSFDLLRSAGLVNQQGRDTFCRRVIFPCYQQGHICNLYGRSIGAAFPHRLLPGTKGDLFAWEAVRLCPTVILVEGLCDLAVLWQAGFRNTTSALGTHLTVTQLAQLCDAPRTTVYLLFDRDENQAGQTGALKLARRIAHAGIQTRLVLLPPGHDPNSYFVAGATTADFVACMEQAQSL